MTPAEPWEWSEEVWRAKTSKVRAGRSLKPESWSGGARCAVALSFDSDHDTIELRDGGHSIGRMSQGQYGSRVAIPRIHAALAKNDVPGTFFVPAVAALLYPDEQRSAVSNGHEVALHGWIHELNTKVPADRERDLHFRAADTLEKITGIRPVGMRTPSWDFSQETLRIQRDLGLIYDSSLMADDEPYELLENGEATGIVELPVEWIRDDAVYFNMNRFQALRPYTPPAAVLDIFIREFDRAYEEGGLFLLTMHPHVTGHRSRIFILEEIIAHIKTKPDIWFATHADIARYVGEGAAWFRPGLDLEG